MVQRKISLPFSCVSYLLFLLQHLINMFALAVEPENSLDIATAAVAAGTAPVESNISPGSQRRRNIHSTHVQHPTISKETDSIHSRTFP